MGKINARLSRDEIIAEKAEGIKNMLEYLNIPGTKRHIEDLADGILKVVSRGDPKLIHMAAVLVAIVQSTYTRDGFNFVQDRQLFDWSVEHARVLVESGEVGNESLGGTKQ